MEDEIRQSLKMIGTDKTTEINGLTYEVYLRLRHMFVPLPVTVCNASPEL